ncbi:hypothetical protein L6164_009751 [Bauhinia variegata]|uniref:Uncharacterized protein n=1 Tax=Bauhinia variegata TaxID=167791 RepID=A0ACB9PRC2_BAUVA|nr:hypothetical protein L6164_009751 [Bauhinia variegata]
MAETKRYVLRLFLSPKHITANVVDRNNGRVVTTASTVEHAIKDAFDRGRTCNSKAAASIGEVEKKGLSNSAKIWAIVNALKNRRVKIIIDDHNNGS